MRIIAGRLKGRTLKGPTGAGVRPTSDRLRETIFNVIQVEPGWRVLDAFAGTGALGLEAMSRGAEHATFVDVHPRSIGVIRENVERCGAGDACAIIRDDFIGVARRHDVGRFDLVLLDPPYDFPDFRSALAEAAALVRAGGLVVLEHSRRREAPDRVGDLTRVRMLRAGDSQLAFYAPATE